MVSCLSCMAIPRSVAASGAIKRVPITIWARRAWATNKGSLAMECQRTPRKPSLCTSSLTQCDVTKFSALRRRSSFQHLGESLWMTMARRTFINQSCQCQPMETSLSRARVRVAMPSCDECWGFSVSRLRRARRPASRPTNVLILP
jgi:hypothetical protein